MCSLAFFFYMEVDEREKISKKKYATVFAYYRYEYNKKCLTKIVAVYVKKMYNMSQRS